MNDDDTRTIEQKLDAFVDGNIKPWFMARLREERYAGTCAAYTSDAALDERMGYDNMLPEPAVPRVITADELEVGQVVAGFAYLPDEGRSNPWMISGQVTVVHRFERSWPLPSGLVEKDGTDCTQITVKKAGFSDTTWDVDTFPHIVLLADAPTTSYAAEDHEDAEVTQWHEERRGEVIDPADLRVGDVYDVWRREQRMLRDRCCKPKDAGDGTDPWRNETGWEFRLVHRPEVTAADIRDSEPGSCYEGANGSIWEWNGRRMQGHTLSSLTGSRRPEWIVSSAGPLTASNATPRGDYTKRELPTEPGSVIQVTEMGGESFGPALAFLDGDGDWWLAGHWLDGADIDAFHITGWNPVTLTVGHP